MELRTIERTRRNEQLSKEMAVKTDAVPDAQASGKLPSRAQAKTDRLAVSRQALAFLEEQNRQAMERAREEAARRKSDQLNGCSEEERTLNFMDKALKGMNKCQKIAARIMAGDKVPPEDERYLMEHDSEGYKMALAMRKPKKHPKEYESVLDDEDRGKTVESSGPEEPAAAGVAESGDGAAAD